MDVFERCPQFSSERFLLRQPCMEDWPDLLKVYSDLDALPIFNSDNCTGDFHITTEKDMRSTISFWLQEYSYRYYVRWSILDRAAGCAVGTIELFNRTARDFYNHVGLLRLDLRSDYENEAAITEILSLLLPRAYDLFACDWIATKIPPCAQVRKDALCQLGFTPSPELLYGHDGRAYGDYYTVRR